MPSGLTLGRPLFDVGSLETIEDFRDALSKILEMLQGAGWPSGNVTGDTVYMQVYALEVGGDHILYGGSPDDPMNPTELAIVAPGTGNIEIYDESETLIGTRSKLLFKGDVTLTDVPADSWVEIDVGSSVSPITIQANGSGLTQRAIINFLPPLTAVDDAGNTRTNVDITATQKTIWGIDPAGGHSVSVGVDAIEIELKVIKYQFDLVALVSEVADSVLITVNDVFNCAAS